jgi:hypothetical protein
MSVYGRKTATTGTSAHMLAKNATDNKTVIDFVELVDLLQDKTHTQELSGSNATSISDNRGGRIEF